MSPQKCFLLNNFVLKTNNTKKDPDISSKKTSYGRISNIMLDLFHVRLRKTNKHGLLSVDILFLD